MSSKKNNIVAVIPARYSSSRFPGKPLAVINGKSMIRTVYDNIIDTDMLDGVFVATDDEKIAEECRKYCLKFVMTGENHRSGTDRIYQAIDRLGISPEIILNVQGDEPLLKSGLISELLSNFIKSGCDVGTVIKRISDKEELFSDSVVKVTTDKFGKALYFSRSIIPYIRDVNSSEWLNDQIFYKHIGIYAYTYDALKKFVELPPSALELAENLEQLRLLESGAEYYCYETDEILAGVDYPEDIKKIEKLLNN